MKDGCSQIMAACQDAGLDVVEPFGGYFILVDTSPLGLEFDTSQVRTYFFLFPLILLIFGTHFYLFPS